MIKKHTFIAIVIGVLLTGSVATRAEEIASPTENNSQSLGLRLWSLNYKSDSTYQDSSGVLTSIFYDRDFKDSPFSFTSMLGFGNIGSSAIEGQLGLLYNWNHFSFGAGFHDINFGTSITNPTAKNQNEKTGNQCAADLIAGYASMIPDTEIGYRLSLTIIPFVTSSEGNGTGNTEDGGLFYTKGTYQFNIGYRYQSIKLSGKYSDYTTTYSGPYIEASKSF